MASRVQPINLLNFTGGLNLRADAFELGQNESPEMLNVDIDPRGGFVARKGWTKVNTDPIVGGGAWDPRTLFVHELADGSDNLFVYSTTVLHSTDGGATWTDSFVTGTADPHGVAFAPWGDTLYCVRGSGQSYKISDVPAYTALTVGGAATWSPYDVPVTCFPEARFVASHQGYMFVAGTTEDASPYAYRIRWSHPNNPEAWHADDYIDIREGGGPITAIVPNRDHLLVFQQSAVWALFGFNSDNWNLVNVSREIGAAHPQAVAQSESQVFFYAHPFGIYAISGDSYPQEISTQLRPAIEDSNFQKTQIDQMWLGWVDQRLWWSVPYFTDGAADDVRTTFVWDPTLGGGNGAWTAYRGADEYGIGPFAQGARGGGGDLPLAACRSTDAILDIDENDVPKDNIDGAPADVTAYYVTPWMDAGMPTLKKSWRRPDVVAKERSLEYDLTIDVFKDFDEANVTRSNVLTVDAGGSGAVWGSFVWGDGSVYGPPAKGSTIERSGNLGPARSVQLRISGTPGRRWGVDAIIFKFIPRRLR